MKITAMVAVAGLLGATGLVSRSLHHTDDVKLISTITSFSVTDSTTSRSATHGTANSADKSTTLVTAKINSDLCVMLSKKVSMTTVKDMLETGGITLDPDNAVSPSLKPKVIEATVVAINRTDADMGTNDTEIVSDKVRKETSSLPKGQEEAETEGQKDTMETTSLIKRAGDKVISSNVFASWVKKTPIDRVIPVGTGSTKSSSSTDLGTTVSVGEVQSWAHQYLLDNGCSKADSITANYITNHEPGWSPTVTDPTSGAYDLGRTYPGSRMTSAGAGWQTSYKAQFEWFISYHEQRYGGVVTVYNY